jgi:hypothetical protein
MMTLNDVLERWIPYRVQAIETLEFAWNWTGEHAQPQEVLVLVEGKVKLRGNVASIANPMIEAGFIHARALLEFLGLCVRKGRLAQVERRQPDDIAVEHFSSAEFPIEKATPEEALAAYPGAAVEAEEALIAIFELANKGMAHVTAGVAPGKYTEQHLITACRGIPVLVHNHLYAKLGRSMPKAPEAVPHGR